VDDEPDDVVDAFGAAVVDAQPDRGEDAVAVLADRFGCLDERVDAGSAGAGQPPVDQLFDLLGVQVTGEDGAEGFLEGVGEASTWSTPSTPSRRRPARPCSPRR
jgi:hypothetical protein